MYRRLAALGARVAVLQPLLEARAAEEMILRAHSVGVEHKAGTDSADVLLCEVLIVDCVRLFGLSRQLLNELRSRRALVGVVVQKPRHKITESLVLRPRLSDSSVNKVLIERKYAHPTPLHDRDPRQELTEHAPHRPHVILSRVTLPRYLLGRGIGERARARCVFAGRNDTGETEVRDLDDLLVILLGEEHVVGLHVPVQHLLAVDVLDPVAQLQRERAHALLLALLPLSDRVNNP
mmetsp:Transcript_66539/g.164035  ORF Transcript_66539/g.164035 Transcript_66539/m.164035 type:complete len:236 (-) Transcript_66539:1055-1762(-)